MEVQAIEVYLALYDVTPCVVEVGKKSSIVDLEQAMARIALVQVRHLAHNRSSWRAAVQTLVNAAMAWWKARDTCCKESH